MTVSKEVVANVAVINQSTVVTDAQVYACTYALQIQSKDDFYPAWGIKSSIYFLDKSKPVPAGHYQLVILDDADAANALGYHDLTATGDPLAKIFAKTTMDAGEQWTVTASHELMEMLVDPYINLTALIQTGNTTGTLYPYEVCDAVQGDNCTYKIPSAGNIPVSNFVYPSWFEDFRAANSVKFDHMDVITQPFQIYHEGYMSYFTIPNSVGWQQVFAAQNPHDAPRGADHSQARKALRKKSRTDWKLSRK